MQGGMSLCTLPTVRISQGQSSLSLEKNYAHQAIGAFSECHGVCFWTSGTIYHLWMIPPQTSQTKLYQYIVQCVPVHIHPSRLDLIAVAASHCSLAASPAAAAAAYPAAAPVTAPKPTAQRSLYNSSTIFCWTAARALTVHPPQNARVSAVWFEMEVEGATGYQPPVVTTLCDKNDKWLGPVCLQRVYSFHRNVWTKWCRVNYVELGHNWSIGVLNEH